MTISRRFSVVLSCVVLWVLLAGCASAAQVPAPRGLDDPQHRRVAEAIISSFENSTTELAYAAAQRLDDGRGITAGRAGFTSGTHDLLLVVQRYETVAGSSTPLHRYLRPLRSIDAQVADGGDGDDTTGLDGFEDAWASTSRTDPRLDQAQDAVYNDLYFRPAMDQAQRAGVTSALGQLAFLDTGVQHGTGTGPDDLGTIVTETGPVADDQAGWLRRFLENRRRHLEHPAYAETADVWQESLPRVDTLESLIDEQRFDLAAPIDWTFAGQRFSVS